MLDSRRYGMLWGARAVGAALDAIPATKNIVPSVEDAANDALLKSIGTSAGQIKQAGKALPIGEALDQARETAEVGRKAGLDNIFSTERGRTANLQNLINKEGQKIGELRNQAGTASPGILDQVKAQLMAKYNPANADVLSGETGDIEKGINTIKNANKPPVGPQNQLSNADIAKGITKLNKYNAGAKALQPVNGLTDVANEASKLNNAEIAQKLGPQGAQAYQQALKNEAGGFHLAPMIERGLNREAVARVGGKGFLQNALQKAMDAGGYRAASKGLNALHGALTEPVAATPIAKNALEAYLANKKENQE